MCVKYWFNYLLQNKQLKQNINKTITQFVRIHGNSHQRQLQSRFNSLGKKKRANTGEKETQTQLTVRLQNLATEWNLANIKPAFPRKHFQQSWLLRTHAACNRFTTNRIHSFSTTGTSGLEDVASGKQEQSLKSSSVPVGVDFMCAFSRWIGQNGRKLPRCCNFAGRTWLNDLTLRSQFHNKSRKS